MAVVGPHSRMRQGISRVIDAIAEANDSAVISPADPIVPFDIEKGFQLFTMFCGDIEKTAHALHIEPALVIEVSTKEKWMERLKPLFEMQKSARPGDIERSINRAMNFVQAHRLRLCVNRMVDKLTAMTDEELFEYCLETQTRKEKETGDLVVTKKIVTRPFADLASAMEKAQALTYQALNDTTTERVKRAENPGEFHSAADLHAELSKRMAEVRASESPTALLMDFQIQQAEQITKEERAP